MAETDELAIAICRLVQISDTPVPIKLANQTVEQAAAIIGAVIETCSRENVQLGQVCIDPELALELGLVGGVALPHGSRPIVSLIVFLL